MKRALITGITGQDGSFLAELLLTKNYHVIGLSRQDSWLNPNNVSHLAGKIEILTGDITQELEISRIIKDNHPDEIYNLASQSKPAESWARISETLAANALGAIRLFEAVRHVSPATRVYHASSSEMYGQAQAPQNEQTTFSPLNPYAAAKVYAHQMARIYRDSYGLYIATGILFNHESERRPLHFVVQKVAYGAACAALNIQCSPDLNERGHPIVENGMLALGNLNIARDWGYAGDFVKAMWLILQQKIPDDFVVGTGQLHTLSELCSIAYHYVGKNWQDHVISDNKLIRPLETAKTMADPTKAYKLLGWRPILSFQDMIQKMVDAQIQRLETSRK